MQNILLTASSLLRLDLYVQTFGLTYLRVHAGVWMGIVALELGLTAWQIVHDRSTDWLLARSAGLGAATLYLASFVNVGVVIASYNMAQDNYDAAYICTLPRWPRSEFWMIRRHPCATPPVPGSTAGATGAFGKPAQSVI